MTEDSLPKTMVTLPHYISLPDAAQRLRLNEAQVRALIESGRIKGGTLPDGEMIVTEDSLPQRKEDLPEYKLFADLRGKPIWISKAAREYSVTQQTISNWVKAGVIKRLGKEGNKVLIDEADVAYCAEIYRQRGGQGKTLFNSDGTPYKSKTSFAA